MNELHQHPPADPLIILPPLPKNPPNMDDVNRATRIRRDIFRSANMVPPGCTGEDVARALLYEHAVKQGALGGVEPAPHWAVVFQNRMENLIGGLQNCMGTIEDRLDGIEVRLDDIDDRLDAMDGRLGGIDGRLGGIDGRLGGIDEQLGPVKTKLNRIDMATACSVNATRGNGVLIPFVVVPFRDGRDPTAPGVNLPALTSITVINGLNATRCNRYLAGYGVPHAPGQADVHLRRQLLRQAIGAQIF
ncbi:hypothetical protein BS47DRAFT_1388478 [Hydnum rufescens UP504]|uniref:Mug135-like C-terminal domain-containing protein n=1 Tax=Hydnum rufescens UP504 TaxID=1448309 RepID=A0A9P6B7B1_9AGAM|nr:hypothetical protein BS47DRAFT_1388478 [Hydnum rufescens UP504]